VKSASAFRGYPAQAWFWSLLAECCVVLLTIFFFLSGPCPQFPWQTQPNCQIYRVSLSILFYFDARGDGFAYDSPVFIRMANYVRARNYACVNVTPGSYRPATPVLLEGVECFVGQNRMNVRGRSYCCRTRSRSTPGRDVSCGPKWRLNNSHNAKRGERSSWRQATGGWAM
jgi:hypothetical protein